VVVFVVSMKVIMFQQLVDILMLVVFRDMEPHAPQHERSTRCERYGERLAERHHGGHRAGERRDGKLGSGARSAEIAQREHEQHQAQPVAE
jgi:hypothetical protein